ncbi:MAG: PQQ-binding-like beta-propeller repeat protein [Maioricimonas sp. JB049]
MRFDLTAQIASADSVLQCVLRRAGAWRLRCLLLAAVVATLLSATSAEADPWTRFRGPNGTGISHLEGVPRTWTEEDYEWTVPLPGIGHSSPVVWENSLFLTSGGEDGSRTLLCLNATTGQTLWTDTVELGANHLHRKNSYASGTPTTDGERVYVAYADAEQYLVLGYSLTGEKLWTRDLGSFSSQHGQGVSPIIHEDLLIVPNDQMGPSSVIALNRRTGETVWESKRNHRRTSYATPFILNVDGREPQLICLSGATGLAGLDPQTGKEIWRSGELPQRTVGSPVFGDGVVIASCGSGGRGKHMVAVDPTGAGDVSGSHVRFERKQNLPYVPTPIMWGGHLYLWNDDGVVCCVDPQTGENVWRERVGGNFSGSPVLIDGALYCISEDGEVVVIDAAPTFRLFGRSPLGDASYATPAVANGRVYLRGFSRLCCLKAGPN